MRIAIIGSRGYPSTYGGFETFVRRFSPYASNAGHEVTVYGRGDGSTFHTGGVRVISVKGVDSKAASTLTHGYAAFRDSQRRRFDVALVLNPANGPFLPLLDCPSVVNPDGLEWRREKWGPLGRTAFLVGAAAVAQWATEIVVDSEAIGRYWQVAFGRNSTFIPYGADVINYHDTGPLDQLALSSRQYALAVARLSPENNIEMIVSAWRGLDRDQPLVVVGDANYDSPTVRFLREVARHESRLRWVGRIDDQEQLASLWGHAAVYFHGHSVGGTNPALLQAMGHGAGPIAYRSPFNLEVLNSREHLFSDAIDLRNKWRRTIDNPERQDAWRAVSQDRVSRYYDWDRACQGYLEVLHRAAG